MLTTVCISNGFVTGLTTPQYYTYHLSLLPLESLYLQLQTVGLEETKWQKILFEYRKLLLGSTGIT